MAHSNLFGTRKEQIIEEFGEEILVSIGLQVLDRTNLTDLPKLRKSRSKLIIEALKNGRADKGNMSVEFRYGTFRFYYRGTPVLEWVVKNGRVEDLYAHDYEHTPATMNQRKEARKAIEEVREWVVSA